MNAANGYTLYAMNERPKLESGKGHRLSMNDLIEAAQTGWSALSEEERQNWKQKARICKNSKEVREHKQQNRILKPVKTWKEKEDKRKKKKGKEADHYDELDSDPECDPGVPMVRSADSATSAYKSMRIQLTESINNPVVSKLLPAAPATTKRRGSRAEVSGLLHKKMEEKKTQDKEKLVDFFVQECKGRLGEVKRCRWLFFSMQTYGNLDQDAMCIPAEMGMCEWSLHFGIMEQYHALIGPWDIQDEDLRGRAETNGRLRHAIPLQGPDNPQFTPQKRQVLKEMLGRCEPVVAGEQGVRVGLYQNEVKERDRIPINAKREPIAQKILPPRLPLFPGYDDGRRWVICLRSEYQDMMDSILFLRNQEDIDYPGFPITPDRFIFLDTLVEALAEFSTKPITDVANWKSDLGGLENPEDPDYTPHKGSLH